LIALVFAIVAICSALKYEFQVTTSPQQFGRVNGTLNLVLHTQKLYTKFYWNTTLIPNQNYTVNTEWDYQIGQVKNASFYWNQ
jgi:hypothetical protein